MLLYELKADPPEVQAHQRAAQFLGTTVGKLQTVSKEAADQILDTAKQVDRAVFKTATGQWVVTKYMQGSAPYVHVEDPHGSLKMFKAASDGTDD
jgi:hypothetical protein